MRAGAGFRGLGITESKGRWVLIEEPPRAFASALREKLTPTGVIAVGVANRIAGVSYAFLAMIYKSYFTV